MSAIVCGNKRSSSFFEELHNSSSPPSSSKRIRCSSSSPISFSPPRNPFAPSPASVSSDSSNSTPLGVLKSMFPDMNQQLLERALEISGNDLDSAIKSLNELRLGSTDGNLGPPADVSAVGFDRSNQLPQEESLGAMANGGVCTASGAPEMDNLPIDGSDWAELFVREMTQASNMDDAKGRASRALAMLEKNIRARAVTEATQSLQKENMMLKEQMESLLRDNNILKRAVTIQHERQKEYDERDQELHHMKQLVSQYQERVRALEVNNYALTMHLRQAQQSNSIPGRFHPDVF